MNNIAVKQLKHYETFAYGFGNVGSNLAFQMICTFILYFYTDVYGIAAASAAAILLISRIGDMIFDPIIGWTADRTNTKFGSYRPYLLFGAFPLAILLMLCFFTPEFSNTGKEIYAFLTYFLAILFYTCIDIPYNAMIPTMTSNDHERAKLSSSKFIGSMVATIIVAGGAKEFISIFNNEKEGFLYTGIIVSILTVLTLLICFLFTKERTYSSIKEKMQFKQIFVLLKTNTPLLVMMIALFFQFTGFTIRNTIMIHYFKYYIGNEELVGLYFVILAISGILGALLTPVLIKVIDKRNTALLSNILFTIVGLIWIFIGNNIIAIIILSILCGATIAISGVVYFAMIADSVDYSEYKVGFRAPGTSSAVATMMTKLATAIGGATVGYILALVNYVPNVIQSTQSISGIVSLVSYVPSIFGIGSIIAIAFYKLDKKFLEVITIKLKANDNISTNL